MFTIYEDLKALQDLDNVYREFAKEDVNVRRAIELLTKMSIKHYQIFRDTSFKKPKVNVLIQCSDGVVTLKQDIGNIKIYSVEDYLNSNNAKPEDIVKAVKCSLSKNLVPGQDDLIDTFIPIYYLYSVESYSSPYVYLCNSHGTYNIVYIDGFNFKEFISDLKKVLSYLNDCKKSITSSVDILQWFSNECNVDYLGDSRSFM